MKYLFEYLKSLVFIGSPLALVFLVYVNITGPTPMSVYIGYLCAFAALAGPLGILIQ